MQICVLAVGRLKERYLREAQAEYLKRLGRYARVEVLEVPDEPVPEGTSPAGGEDIRAREGERLLARLDPRDLVVALTPAGQQVTSEELAARLEQFLLAGQSNLAFLLGGTLGLAPAVLQRAGWQLSLSRLTFPHQLARIVLLEQLYRSFRILRHEPYHH